MAAVRAVNGAVLRASGQPFDIARADNENQYVRVRRLTVAVAVMLVASVTTSAWANCIAEIGMTAGAQMACCEHGHDKCPMHRTAESCCQGESQRHVQVNAATHELLQSIVSPPALVVVAFPATVVPPVARLSRVTSARDTLKGPDPPPYLVGSAFLV